MNTNDKVSTNELQESIELLSKNLYLESPDLWIDFSDKMSDNNFDEMVLFFAIKYNHPTIVKYALENKLINLEAPSRNKAFKSIKEHLLSISNKNNDLNISNYILGLSNESNKNKKSKDKINQNTYIPTYICSTCKSNIFLSGFITTDKITHLYSNDLNKVITTHTQTLDNVVCKKCNSPLHSITPEKLNSLSTIQNCSSCGLNLTTIGITDKNKLVYDSALNKFISSNTSYHCSNCDNKLNEAQLSYFNLQNQS